MHPTDDGRTEEADIIEPVSGHGKVIAKSFEELAVSWLRV